MRIPDRPQLKKLLRDATQGDVVIVAAVDRLLRDTIDLLVIARDLQKAGAGLRSIAERGVLPWNFRKPRLEGRRQAAGSFRDDFEAARRRVKSLVVSEKAVKVETVDEAHDAGDVVADILQSRRGRFQKA